MNVITAEWSEWFIVFLGSVLWLCAGVSVSMPWFSAHLAFWGRRENNADDIKFARRLSGLCLASLVPVVLIGAALSLLASTMQPAVFFSSVIALVRPLGASLLLLLVFVVLASAHSRNRGWGLKFGFAHLMMVPAGVLMALGAGLVWVFALSCMGPHLLDSEGGWNLRFWSYSSFWWPVAHFYLSAFSVGGLVLMFLGGKAFRWESSVSVANGARWVRLGARFSLSFLMIQAGLAGVWLFFRGSDFMAGMLASGGTAFVTLLIIGAVSAVLLFELLLGALRRDGSVRIAGSLAIFLVFILAVSVNSARLTLNQNDFSIFQPDASAGQAQGRSR
ncbi:MAG: hypothetical protein OXG62_05600 [Nitrospinae bacterium]|nr:hypothetical protein [Nitrospinota bacterium]